MAHRIRVVSRGLAAAFTCIASAPIAVWAQTPIESAKLFAADAAAGQNFGHSVALSSDLMVIGAPDSSLGVHTGGAVHVFRRIGGEWVEEDVLVASIPSEAGAFGFSVAVDSRVGEGRILVGSPSDGPAGDSPGRAFVFDHIDGIWTETARFTGALIENGSQFGFAVALDGNQAAIGAIFDDGGAAYVFENSGASWVQRARFAVPFIGNHSFGESVAIQGEWMLAGDPPDDNVHVHRRIGGAWQRVQNIRVTGTPGLLGTALAIDGDTIVLGADAESPTDPGEAYVYGWNGAAWAQTQVLGASDAGAVGDAFGDAVAIRGNTAVIGARSAPGAGNGEGAAYVFKHDGAAWVEIAKLSPSTTAPLTTGFGRAVGVSGDSIVVGTTRDDEAGTAAGAAFAFLRGEVLAGYVDIGDGSPPVDVLTLNGGAGDALRKVAVAAGMPATLGVGRAPVSVRGAYGVWIVDGDVTAGAPILRKRGTKTFKLGAGAACLPLTNTVAPGLCPCPSTVFPVGWTSKGLGPSAAARFCLNPAPAFPLAPTTFEVIFPVGDFLIGGVVEDGNAFHSPDLDVSVANWIRVESR